MDRHLWQITFVRDLFWFAFAFFLLWIIYRLSSIFMPVSIALLFAYLCNPLLNHAEKRWRWGRPITAAIIMAVFGLIVAGFLIWLGPLVSEQITTLAQRTPDYIRVLASKAGLDIEDLMGQLDKSIREFQEEPRQILRGLFTTTGKAFFFMKKFFGATTYLILAATMIPVFFFIFAWRFNTILQGLKRYLPASRRERIIEIVGKMDKAVALFFRGRFLISLIMGVLFSLGWMATGVPYWAILGMITGFLNIIPYVSIIGWPVAILLKYAEAVTSNAGLDFLSIAVWPSATYFAVQFFENWFLTPWIQSDQTDMNVATVMIVVFIGGATGGILGLLLAIPIAACAKIFLEEVVLPHWQRWASEN